MAWDVAARGAPQRERGCEVSWEGGGGRVCKSRVYGNDYGDGDDDDDGNDYGDDDDDDLRAGIMALCKSVAIFAQPDPGAF